MDNANRPRGRVQTAVSLARLACSRCGARSKCGLVAWQRSGKRLPARRVHSPGARCATASLHAGRGCAKRHYIRGAPLVHSTRSAQAMLLGRLADIVARIAIIRPDLRPPPHDSCLASSSCPLRRAQQIEWDKLTLHSLKRIAYTTWRCSAYICSYPPPDAKGTAPCPFANAYAVTVSNGSAFSVKQGESPSLNEALCMRSSWNTPAAARLTFEPTGGTQHLRESHRVIVLCEAGPRLSLSTSSACEPTFKVFAQSTEI